MELTHLPSRQHAGVMRTPLSHIVTLVLHATTRKTDDKAFDVQMLHKMAKRISATVTEVKASHAVFMTQPKVGRSRWRCGHHELTSPKQFNTGAF